MKDRLPAPSWLSLVLLLAGSPLRAEDATAITALLEHYPKGEIIRVVVSRCGGDITVSQPPDTRVFGRPREDLITVETIQTDLHRCGISVASLEQKVQESVEWSEPKGKVYRHRDPTAAAKLAATQKKLTRQKEQAAKAKAREEQKATRDAELKAAHARKAALAESQVAARAAERKRLKTEQLKSKCAATRERRDDYYERSNEARHPQTRQRYRDLYEEERAWIRANC